MSKSLAVGGIRCPKCGEQTSVRFTRQRDNHTIRRRRCVKCETPVTTSERIVGQHGDKYIPETHLATLVAQVLQSERPAIAQAVAALLCHHREPTK